VSFLNGSVVRVEGRHPVSGAFMLVRIAGDPPSFPVCSAEHVQRDFPIVLAGKVAAVPTNSSAEASS